MCGTVINKCKLKENGFQFFWGSSKYEGNEFRASYRDTHRAVTYFARDPLRSYFNESKKKKRFFLYLHFSYNHSTHYFLAFCVKFANHTTKNVTYRRSRPLRSTAVVMTWRQSNVSSMYELCWSIIGSSKESLRQCKYFLKRNAKTYHDHLSHYSIIFTFVLQSHYLI